MTEPWRLIGDVGGTNVRFARSDSSADIHDQWVAPVDRYQTFAAALTDYLGRVGNGAQASAAVIAAAGPVADGEIRLTNSSWRICERELATLLGPGVATRLVNDLEAVAFALPHLPENRLQFADLRPRVRDARQRMLAVNVGTGFGSASLIRDGERWVCCPSESGHMRLAADNAEELALFSKLEIGQATVEDILSGGGLQRLQAHVAEARPEFGYQYFTGFLARACADLVLASAAWDGLYLCGSVATAWWQRADLDEFRRLFVGTSKMSHQLRATPIALIDAELPALIGLAHLNVGHAD